MSIDLNLLEKAPIQLSEINAKIEEIAGALDTISQGLAIGGPVIAKLASLQGFAGIPGLYDPNYSNRPTIKFSKSAFLATVDDIKEVAKQRAKEEGIKMAVRLQAVAYGALDLLLQSFEDLAQESFDYLLANLSNYTGFPMDQLRFICNLGFRLLKTYMALKMLEKNDEYIPGGVQTSITLDKDQIKQDMKDWLYSLSDALWNGFLCIMIYDEIYKSLEIVKNGLSNDPENLEDLQYRLDTLMEFLNEIGLSDDNPAMSLDLDISVSEFANLGKNIAGGLFNSFAGAVGNSLSNSIKINIHSKYAIEKKDNEKRLIELQLFADPSDEDNIDDFYSLLDSLQSFQEGDKLTLYKMSQEVWNTDKDYLEEKSFMTLNGMFILVNIVKNPPKKEEEPTLDFEDLNRPAPEVGVPESQVRIIIPCLRILISHLKTLLPILEQISHLISNYITNRKKVLNHSIGNLNAFKKLYDKIKNILRKDSNEWNIIETRNRDSLLAIGKNPSSSFAEIELTYDEAVSIENTYRKPEEIDPNKKCICIFNENGAADTEYDEDGSITYPKDGKSMYSSELIENFNHLKSSYNEFEDTKNFKDDITKISDESEGDSIDLSNSSLCGGQVEDQTSLEDELKKFEDYLNSDKFMNALNGNPSTRKSCIIEFAKESKDSKEVPYEFTVTPGQEINSNTLIARFSKDKSYEMTSIFSSGKVREDSNGNFWRFGNDLSRHIIIDNCELNSEEPAIISSLETYANKIKTSNNIENLIISSLNDSIYPYILCHRDDSIKIPPSTIEGKDEFEKWKEHLQKTKDNFYEKYKDSNISKKAQDEIMNSQKDLKSLAYSKMKEKEEFFSGNHDWNSCKNGLIDLYENHLNEIRSCKYDILYTDCQSLIQDYYIDLLENIDISDSDFSFGTEYYDLISRIIAKRYYIESFSKEDYIKIIQERYGYLNGYKENIVDWLNKNFDIVSYKNASDISNYVKENSVQLKKDETVTQRSETCRKLSNMYIFYKTFDFKKIENTEKDNYEFFKLTKEEEYLLSSFWKNLLKEYKTTYNVNNILQEIQSQTSTNFIWPSPEEIIIDGEPFDYYFIAWKDKVKDDSESETVAEVPAEPVAPEQPSSIEAPSDAKELFDQDPDENDADLTDDEYSFFDLEYWQKYFAMATIATLLPGYWATGIVIPPSVFVPLPAVYIPFGVIPLKEINFLIVIGMSIRGLMIEPIILYVNLSNELASAITTPALYAIENLKKAFSVQFAEMENALSAIVQGMINANESSIKALESENIILENYIKELKKIQFPGMNEIKNTIKSVYMSSDARQSIRRLQNL